jgi:hypothetical protein
MRDFDNGSPGWIRTPAGPYGSRCSARRAVVRGCLVGAEEDASARDAPTAVAAAENKIRGSFQNERGFGFQNEQTQRERAVA